jgi:hypothetical protein
MVLGYIFTNLFALGGGVTVGYFGTNLVCYFAKRAIEGKEEEP